MDPERLEHLRVLAREATPGGWYSERDQVMDAGRYYTVCYVGDPENDSTGKAEANADFIAAADPSTILALLDDLASLRAQYEEACALLREMGEYADTFDHWTDRVPEGFTVGTVKLADLRRCRAFLASTAPERTEGAAGEVYYDEAGPYPPPEKEQP